MHIATIQSRIIPRPSEADKLEYGVYELEVHVNMAQALVSGDPQGFVNNEVAVHLAFAIHDTGLPLHEGLWNVTFTDWAQSTFNYPKGFTA